MNKQISEIAKAALSGSDISRDDAAGLAGVTGQGVYDLLYWANAIRYAHHGDRITLCSVISAKQGKCTEDCRFCAQSVHHQASIAEYDLVERNKIVHAADNAKKMGSHRFGIVTSGESACDTDDWSAVLDAVRALVAMGSITPCASLGSLTKEAAEELRQAGLERYHHNLETSEGHFPNICSTHSFEDRVDTIRVAKDAGLEVCCGGIFGVGETWEDRIDLAFTLRELGVDSVPLNFLNPIPGTPLGDMEPTPPLDLLKIIALYRFILPEQEIRVCGGREVSLRDLQSWMFYAGANGTMIGNYLTTEGRCADDDRRMFHDLGMTP
ncbi:MAG: biotin synthase BioB [Planctomycetes bacterium]|nr:biotin synthase BioB [Planctomycetota bacterium]